MVNLLYCTILVYNHSYAAKMVLLVIKEGWILIIIKRAIAAIEEILV